VEVSEGVSKKSGKPYSMGQLHTLTPLAPPMGEGNIAKGAMGSTYECDPVLLRKLEHLPFPVLADVELAAQMRFGERREIVMDVKPVERVKVA
jgi:hypothetical protein